MRHLWASWTYAVKNRLEEESVGALVTNRRPKGPQFPFLVLWQEGETGAPRSVEEKLFSRGCQTVTPNHQHLKYSSAFQIVQVHSLFSSLVTSNITSFFALFISNPCVSPLSFHSVSANGRYNGKKRELMFPFVHQDKINSWKESSIILNIEIWRYKDMKRYFALYI